jgi:16S rRNA (guanine966-N2)-methyltransferase
VRIIAGAWRGRTLRTPPGSTTRPTADRVRQALFDMLWHADWAGRDAIEGARVIDLFGGTGALGLEALSRSAASAVFIERDRTALCVLRDNIAICHAEALCRVLPIDATRLPAGDPADLVFMDPPYRQNLVAAALQSLAAGGWLRDGTLVVAELAADEAYGVAADLLTDRTHGAARIVAWRHRTAN